MPILRSDLYALKKNLNLSKRAYAKQHSLISNHLAGAALGLFKAGEFFQENRYLNKAHFLLNLVLKNQSPEGWFPEYGGADPGYQTLCMHYLAQIYKIERTPELRQAFIKSLEFLKHFAHPDGTFGGEYGSRRTEIYYPGGIALLAGDFPDAASLHQFMLSSIESRLTITPADVDMGNSAPLLNSYILALDVEKSASLSLDLPINHTDVIKDFPFSGLAVRSTKNFYLILGSSNGGVLKIYDKKSRAVVFDDCGALGVNLNRKKITTQSTQLNNALRTEKNELECESFFYPIRDDLPNPLNYLVLRLMNLSVMRIGFLNEIIKKIMVSVLVKNNKRVNLIRTRRIKLKPQCIEITDTFKKLSNDQLAELSQGFKFTSIHMASARYFSPAQINQSEIQILDHAELNNQSILVFDHKVLLKHSIENRS